MCVYARDDATSMLCSIVVVGSSEGLLRKDGLGSHDCHRITIMIPCAVDAAIVVAIRILSRKQYEFNASERANFRICERQKIHNKCTNVLNNVVVVCLVVQTIFFLFSFRRCVRFCHIVDVGVRCLVRETSSFAFIE